MTDSEGEKEGCEDGDGKYERGRKEEKKAI